MARTLLALLLAFGMASAANIIQYQTRYVRQASINQPVLRVSKTDLQDTGMMWQIDTPWEQFIMPAPTVISLLGGLTVLSGKVDFPLNERPPAGGFKHIRHPDSFRASLVQVSNDGWSAFHNAHRNMDTIQLNMQQIPVHVKTAMKVIAGAPAELFQQLLQVPLTTIKDVGRQCVDLAKETELKFVEVMLLMGEILETTASAKGLYDTKLAEAERELNASVVQKQQLDNIGTKLEQREQSIKKAVEKYQAAYEGAMKSIPTGWELIGQKFVAGLADGVNSFVKMSLNPVGTVRDMFGSRGSGGGGGSAGGAAGTGASAQQDNIMDTIALTAVESLYNQLQEIKQAMTDVFDGTNKGNPREMFSAYGSVLNAIKTQLGGYAGSNIATRTLGFVQTGQALVSDMKALSGSLSGNSTGDGRKQEMLNRMDRLMSDVGPFYVTAVSSKQDTSIGKPPGNEGGSGGAGGGSFVDQGSDNARFKAQISLSQLQNAEKQYDKVFDDMMKHQEALKNLMVRMATLNMETINFREILDLMKEGIKALSEIRKQWSKLTEFFTMIAVRAEFTVNQLLNPFVKQAETLQQVTQISPEARNFMLQLLVPQAQEIHKAAYFLYTLSKTYVDVSSRYILDRLAGLAALTALEPAQRSSALAELQRTSEAASADIRQMAIQRKAEYKTAMAKKIAEGQNYIQQLGGVSDAQVQAVKKGVDAVQKKKDNPEDLFEI